MTFTFTSYIKDHAGPSFNIVKCFRASKLTDKKTAEEEFKKAIRIVSYWKTSKAQLWALKQVCSKFIILSNVDLQSYWVEVTKNAAVLKGKRTYYEFCGEAAETMDSQKTEEIEEEEEDYSSALTSDSETDGGSFNLDSQSGYSSETPKIRRRQKVAHDYLVGGGLEQYDRPNNCKKWISSDLDLVNEFLAYRLNVVKEAKEFELLSVVDRLALNFICYITPSSAIGNKMDQFVWSTMVQSVKIEHCIKDISDQYVLWMMKISQAARRSTDEAKALVRKWVVEDDSEEATLYQDILRDMFKSYSDVYDPSKINEDTFVKDTLTPIFKNYFPNDQLIRTEGANGEIIGSKERKKVFDAESGGKRGDFTVYTCDGAKSQLLCLIECKPPRAGNSDDLAKAANSLKDCMDKSARDGVDCHDLQLFAIVSEGYRCRVLCLDLKYHGMYRLVDIGTFYIPSSINNMDTMLGVFQMMNYVKMMVLKGARLSKKSIRIKENNSQDMTLPSFDSPVRVSEHDVLKMLQNNKEAFDRACRKLRFEDE